MLLYILLPTIIAGLVRRRLATKRLSQLELSRSIYEAFAPVDTDEDPMTEIDPKTEILLQICNN